MTLEQSQDPSHSPQQGTKELSLLQGTILRGLEGLFTDLPTLSMDQWVLEIRLLHALVAPAAHVVIPEQNLLPQVIPFQSPRELQSGELTSQKLRVDKGQLLNPLPLGLWGELRAQGPYLIPPHQDGPGCGFGGEGEVCGSASILNHGLPPAGPSPKCQWPALPMSIPCSASHDHLRPAR